MTDIADLAQDKPRAARSVSERTGKRMRRYASERIRSALVKVLYKGKDSPLGPSEEYIIDYSGLEQRTL